MTRHEPGEASIPSVESTTVVAPATETDVELDVELIEETGTEDGSDLLAAVGEVGERKPNPLLELWDTVLAEQMSYTLLMRSINEGSPFRQLAIDALLSTTAPSPTLGDLYTVLMDRMYSPDARQMAAAALVERLERLDDSDLLFLTEHAALLSPADCSKLGAAVAKAASHFGFGVDESWKVAAGLLNLCDEPKIRTQLLTAVEVTGKNDPNAALFLIEYGSAKQQTKAWTYLTNTNDSHPDWATVVQRVVTQCPSYADRAWQRFLCTEYPITLTEQEVPDHLVEDYRTERVRRAVSPDELLIDYTLWSDHRDSIRQHLLGKYYSFQEWNRALTIHSALLRSDPGLSAVYLCAQAYGLPLAELRSSSVALEQWLTSNRILETRVETEEKLSFLTFQGLCERFPIKRPLLIEAAAARRDQTGLLLQAMLITNEFLNPQERSIVKAGAIANLNSRTLGKSDTKALTMLIANQSLGGFAEQAFLNLLNQPPTLDLIDHLADYCRETGNAQRVRLITLLATNPKLAKNVVLSIAANPVRWGLSPEKP